MIEGTKLVSPSAGSWTKFCDSCHGVAPSEISTMHTTVLQAATTRVKDGFRVAMVNAASAYHCGGGFLTGGRHALEEALCVQTTLYSSLEQMQRIVDHDYDGFCPTY